MSGDATFVFALIAAAGVLMASNRVRFDIVALLVVLALMLSGILSVGEALSGFGNSVVITVAGLLVVGEMLALRWLSTPLCRHLATQVR
jgi:di/tricarboxylate transporter